MHKIIVRRRVTDIVAWSKNLHPILRRVYAARQVNIPEELEHGLDRLFPFDSLLGMEQAVELLYVALQKKQRILIVADFDADGATSCAVAIRALRLLGASDLHYVVPNRFEYGYGLTPEIVAVAAQYKPALLITVDNGITSLEGVAAARTYGMRVLITDHHLSGAQLPDADAIVNPNQPGDRFPSKNLAGVGVIFYVMLALRARLRRAAWFQAERPEPNLAQLLDLVALGTVADVVPLDHNNRILVSQGLARIRAGHCQPGVRALLESAGRSVERIVAADLGFAIAPRLNAAGRLEDMSLGITCLLSDRLIEARAAAARLDELNKDRRAIETRMQEEALTVLQGLELDEDHNLPYGVCLYGADWHQGVIGILASRVKDRLHRPVIVFAPAGDGELKGSARSVAGLHIRDALDTVATDHPGLLSKFGGHAMAAGLSLPESNLPTFRIAFDKVVRRHLSAEDLQGIIWSDGELEPEHFNVETAETLRSAGPWGQAFPEPMFDGEFDVLERRIMGECHLKLALRHPGNSRVLEAILFNADETMRTDAQRTRVVYRLDVNDYRGTRTAQLVVTHMEPLIVAETL